MISISTSQIFCSWKVIFHLRWPMTFLSLRFYDTLGLALGMNVLFWGIPRWTLEVVIQEVLWSIREFYLAIWSLPLTNVKFILTLDLRNEFPTDQTFRQFHNLNIELDFHWITSGFYGAFATGVACHHGTLTLPDTWTGRVSTRLFTLNTPRYFLDFSL